MAVPSKKGVFLSAALCLVLLTLPVQASGCLPASSHADVTIGSGQKETMTYYIVADVPGCGGGCIGSAYVYQEANGQDGLQRKDWQQDDTCGGSYPADLVVA